MQQRYEGSWCVLQVAACVLCSSPRHLKHMMHATTLVQARCLKARKLECGFGRPAACPLAPRPTVKAARRGRVLVCKAAVKVGLSRGRNHSL